MMHKLMLIVLFLTFLSCSKEVETKLIANKSVPSEVNKDFGEFTLLLPQSSNDEYIIAESATITEKNLFMSLLYSTKVKQVELVKNNDTGALSCWINQR